MITQSQILFTGGSGRLGTEVRKLLPGAMFPDSKIFNATNPRQMLRYALRHRPKIIIHAAAFTKPQEAEKQPAVILANNIIGTANVAALCLKLRLKLIYISTDYVFKGDRGNYKEDDAVFPVNKYAWSKLGGECAVRLLPDYLIVRTSLGDKVFPYGQAFVDHFTSRESVDVIAKKLVKTIRAGVSGTIHIGHKRRSVYDYARSLDAKKSIGKISIKDMDYLIPKDTSLNTAKFNRIVKKGN